MSKTADVLAGLVFLLLGLGLALEGATYRIGTAARMGPGYFPVMVGVLLTIVGAIQLVQAVRLPGPLVFADWDLRSVVAITAAVVLFGATLTTFGLVIATALSVATSTLAPPGGFSPVRITLLTVGLCILCGVVFIAGLGMAVPFLPDL